MNKTSIGGIKENNPNWRGGKSLTPHGYILLRVGIGHPLADCRGYAYEHRVVASNKIGRLLSKTEKVHHIDKNKLNNSPDNLEVVSSNAEHYFRHRKHNERQRPNESNQLIKCACGCGSELYKYDLGGRPRKYISGHNTKRRYEYAKN